MSSASDGEIPLSRHIDFRRLWAAQAVSAVGSRITRTVLPMIAISSLGASAVTVSLLGAVAVAPGVVVAVFLAGVIDRARKRPVLIAMDLLRAGLLLTLAIAALLGVLTMAHLMVVAALVGISTAIFSIADNAYLPRLIDHRHLVEGNSKLQRTDAIAEIAGPTIGGLLVQTVTAPVAILADALSFLWSAWWLKRIKASEVAAPPSASARRLTDAADGWRACRQNPVVFSLLLAQGTFGLFGGFFAAIYMLFALRTLGLDASTVGVLIGLGGVGALWGAFAVAPLCRHLGVGRAVIVCLACWMLASALIPAAEGQGALVLPFLAAQQLVGDGFLAAFLILVVSIRQTALSEDVQARAGATFQVVEGLSLPVGMLAAGPLAGVVGTGGVLWVAVAGAGVPLAILATSRLWTLRTFDELRNSA